MALFSSSEITTLPPLREDGDHYTIPAHSEQGPTSFIVGRHGVDLATLLPSIEKDHHYLIPSRGDWSLHDMLDYLLLQTGPADVWITSWGITENPLRMVLDMCAKDRITSLACIFDPRVRTQCPDAHQLALNKKVRLVLKKNHSKLLVLLNADWGVFVHSSANLTLNERLEFYYVTTFRRSALWNRDWIELEMDGGQPFASE